MWVVIFIENKTGRMICHKQTKIIPRENDMVIIEKQYYQVYYVVFDYDKFKVYVMINKGDV